ncbi:transcriptional regulatory protein [Apiospora arundinis]
MKGTPSPAVLRHCVPSSKVKFPRKGGRRPLYRAFFQHMHPNFVLFHRPTFQRVYEEIWRAASMDHEHHHQPRRRRRRRQRAERQHRQRRHGDHHASNQTTYVSVGWLGCLYMIFIFGCRSLPRKTTHTLDFQRRYYAEMTGLPQLLVTLSLPNVAVRPHVLSLHTNNTNDRTAAWNLPRRRVPARRGPGHAPAGRFGLVPPVTRELRKRVWWTLYCYEQNLCCSLGRPSAIDDREVDVDYPDETILPAPRVSPRPRRAARQALAPRGLHPARASTTRPLPRRPVPPGGTVPAPFGQLALRLPPDLQPMPASERRNSATRTT